MSSSGFRAGRIATGRRAGQRVLRLGDRIAVDDLRVLEGARRASLGGVSLHANVAVPAPDRRRLERLCRYVARPPVATERLSRLEDGRLLYRLKHCWRDGTTHVVFEPQELLEKRAALVPPPRFHLARYHGILGPPAARLRSRRVRVPSLQRAHGADRGDPPAGGDASKPRVPGATLARATRDSTASGRRWGWGQLGSRLRRGRLTLRHDGLAPRSALLRLQGRAWMRATRIAPIQGPETSTGLGAEPSVAVVTLTRLNPPRHG